MRRVTAKQRRERREIIAVVVGFLILTPVAGLVAFAFGSLIAGK